MEEERTYLTSDLIPSLKLKVMSRQEQLVSGVNIKTVNNESVLGSGNIEVVSNLYGTTGENTDGAMTQKATTDAINTVASDVSSNTASISNLSTSVSSLATDVNAVKDELSNSVQFDTTLAPDASSTVTLRKKVGAFNSPETATETDIALPVANESQAGVVNPATYQSIQDTAEKVQNILESAIAVENLPANATQVQLTNAWKEATGKEAVLNGAKILDTANDKTWTYYTNVNKWEFIDNVNPTVEVTGFTNNTLGTLKGDENTPGKIFAEADFTGSVNGWDDLSSKVDNAASSVNSLTESKQDKLTSGTNIKTINGSSILGSGDITTPLGTPMTVQEFLTAWEAA